MIDVGFQNENWIEDRTEKNMKSIRGETGETRQIKQSTWNLAIKVRNNIRDCGNRSERRRELDRRVGKILAI